MLASAAGSAAGASASQSHGSDSHSLAALTKMAYNSQAIFALCSWPFSLKLLWAPIVDACYSQKFGRRKSWLVPIQLIAGLLMVGGSDYVEKELGLDSAIGGAASEMHVQGVTAFFFTLYFLMATQDIAVDGWALTMLSRKNRGKGPICNSIGQNIGYFLSYVGFLALNDVDSSENLWRPLLGLKSRPGKGLVSLGGFVKFMGSFMLVITIMVSLFKKEIDMSLEGGDCCTIGSRSNNGDMERLIAQKKLKEDDEDEDHELDAAEIGIAETYRRLWTAVKLPAVQTLIMILLTYRLPCALSDNVKFLKAVEFGILVPIIGTKIWRGYPMKQFMWAYKFRVTVVALVDVLMLLAVRAFRGGAHNIVGGGTWPASFIMYLVGQYTIPPECSVGDDGIEVCTGGRDAYFPLQLLLSGLGCLWVFIMGKRVQYVADLPDDAWQTHIGENEEEENEVKQMQGKAGKSK
eukprot:scaffold8623_cov69-Cyclotella_meneghiniana.AAC.3